MDKKAYIFLNIKEFKKYDLCVLCFWTFYKKLHSLPKSMSIKHCYLVSRRNKLYNIFIFLRAPSFYGQYTCRGFYCFSKKKLVEKYYRGVILCQKKKKKANFQILF
ncbi:unnamed protein product [Meganyctiphanes norvegica]|uniref:Uncharacterized protein n=1 Tax=Meganyctiphanes norvegica TaxID=48144 RepID=A0AAV2SQV4_MEGNR